MALPKIFGVIILNVGKTIFRREIFSEEKLVIQNVAQSVATYYNTRLEDAARLAKRDSNATKKLSLQSCASSFVK